MKDRLVSFRNTCTVVLQNTNCVCSFKTIKAVLPHMMERNHGHIVNVASIAGFTACNGLSDYCASKFAAVGFNDALDLELHAAGSAVRTTVVCPYFINTGMFDGCQTRFESTQLRNPQQSISISMRNFVSGFQNFCQFWIRMM